MPTEPDSAPSPRVHRGIALLAALAAAALLLRLGLAWVARLPYPYDLEWMEGGMLSHAWRIANGQPVYVRPGPEFTPFIYPPGYPAVLAALGSVAGLSPLLGRLVSLSGTLLAAATLFHCSTRGRGRMLDGGLVAASFLGCAWWGGMFTDLVRPDGLLLGLLGLATAMVLTGSARIVVGAGLVLALAFLVKQNAAFYGPALLLAAWLRHGRAAAIGFGLAAAGPALLAVGLLQWQTDGLFLTYLLAVPSSHPLIGVRAFPGAWLELAQPLAPTLLGAAALLLARLRAAGLAPSWAVGAPLVGGVSLAIACAAPTDDGTGIPLVGVASFAGLTAIGAVLAGGIAGCVALGTLRTRSSEAAHVLPLVATALATAVWMRAHSGGYLNVHLPFFYMAALATGVALRRAEGLERPVLHVLFTVQLAGQLALTPFADLVPTEADRQAGDALVRTLKNIEGPVWSPYATWLPTYAGHAPMSHQIALMDVSEDDGPLVDDLSTVRTALVQQEFGAILTSQRALTDALGVGPSGRPVPLDAHYRLRTKLHHPAGALRPRTGWRVELTAIWVPQ
jgi:hypothetical protein